MPPVWTVFAGLLALAVCCKSWRSARVGALLLANWALCRFAVGGLDPVPLATIDWVTAILVVIIAEDELALGIAAVFVVEMAAHMTYGVFGPSAASDYQYWFALYYGVWAQAFILAIWTGRDGLAVVAQGWRSFTRGRRNRLSGRAHTLESVPPALPPADAS